MSRKLLSTRRTVASALPQYLAAWGQLRSFAEEQGAHAWLFQSDENPHVYMEFIEWKQEDDAPELPSDSRLIVLRHALDRFGPSTEELWTQPQEE